MSGGIIFPGFTSYVPPIMGFRTPVGDFLSNNMANLQGTRCEQFELNFYRCVEAFGLIASKRMCDLEYRDLYECAYQPKQKARILSMKKERMKQFLDGKRDRPYSDDPPTHMQRRPDWYYHNDTMHFNNLF